MVCLQELKAASERFPEAALREAGYGAIWHGQKSWNGVAILARAQSRSKPAAGDPHDTRETRPSGTPCSCGPTPPPRGQIVAAGVLFWFPGSQSDPELDRAICASAKRAR